MRLDISTLTVIASVIFATQTVALFVQYKVNKTYKGLEWWLAGSVLQTLGFLLMPLLNIPSVWFLSILGNPTVVLGQVFLIIGFNKFLGRKGSCRTLIVLFALFLVFYFYFIFMDNSILGRSLVVSVSTAVISLTIAYTVFHGKKKSFSGSVNFTTLVFFSYGCAQIAMTLMEILLPPLSSYREFYQTPARILVFIFPIIASTLWTFGFIIMVNQRLNADNLEEKEKVQKLLSEKELILKEVHHRIKNNMSTICSLLSLQAGTLKDPVSITALKDAGNRIQSMVMIYDRLNKSGNFVDMSVADYLPDLVDEILSNFSDAVPVKSEKHIDNFVLEIKKLQTLGIIVNELLTNIMKYAFVGRTEGLISVSASLVGNEVAIVVQDNGNGMPEGIDFENTTGFGLQLVQALTMQLNGRIRIERGEGTRIVLEFSK